MTLSSSPWWCAPVLALGWIETVPAQIFWAPTRARLIAALRSMPGVCAVFGSSEWPGITRTPSCFHFGSVIAFLVLARSRLGFVFMQPLWRDRYPLIEFLHK